MAIKVCTGTTSQPYVHVQARLSQAATITATGLDAPLVTDATGVVGGTYSISLWAASDLTPTGTYYTVTEFLGSTDNTFNVQVPSSAGPFVLSSILVGTPTASPTPNHVSTLVVDGTSGVAINAAGDVAARSLTVSSSSPYASNPLAVANAGLLGLHMGAQFAAPVTALSTTQSLYARSQPAPSGEATIYPFVGVGSDPNNPTYMWAFGTTSLKLGYSTDHGATFTPVIASPNAALSILQVTITTNFMWVLLSGVASKSGQLWRSPAPNSTGSNIAFTKIFDLTGQVNGPGGAGGDGPLNSAFINACFAVQADESKAYLVTYGQGNALISLGASGADCIMNLGSDIIFSPSGFSGAHSGGSSGAPVSVAGAGSAGGALVTTIAESYTTFKARLATAALTAVTAAVTTFTNTNFGAGVVLGGPRIYVSSNPNTAAPGNVVWSQGFGWGFAKHAHAVKIIGGVPWVSLGDWPFPTNYSGSFGGLTHVGLWAATDSTGTAFNYRMPVAQTTPFDMINFFPISISGQTMIVGESDSRYGHGPTFFPSQSNAVGTLVPIIPTLPTALPQVSTMRCLTVTPEGNLMWLGTGEGGAVGPVDCMMIAYPPAFSQSIVLEQSVALNNFGSGSVYNGIIDGPYVWFGNNRITREKFIGQ